MIPSRLAFRPRESGRAAPVAVLVLVVAVAVTAGYVLTRRGPAPKDLAALASRMAPESAQALLAVDFTQMGFTEARQREALQSLRQIEGVGEIEEQMGRELGLKLDDFLAWIEPAAFVAVAPLEGKPSLFSETGTAQGPPPVRAFVAFKVKDDAKAGETLKRVTEKAEIKFKTESHGGATIYVPEKADAGPSWTLHDKLLVVGIAPQDVKGALDARAGKGRTLADTPRYQQAVARLKHTGSLLVYADLQGMLTAAPLDQPGVPNEAKQFVRGIRSAVAGAGLDGRELISEFLVSVDPKEGGPIVGDVFKPAYGMDMNTFGVIPADTEMVGAFNAKMIWQIAYDVMGRFPDGRAAREMPSMQLSQQGIDLKADVLDALTGEIAYAFPNYSELAAASLSDGPDANPVGAFERMKMVFVVGLAKRDKIEGLLNKLLPEPVRMSLATSEHQGTQIHTMEGKVSYAFVDDNLVVAVNDAEAQVRKLIDSRKSGGVKAHPGYQRALTLAGAKPIMASFANPRKVYGGMADALQVAQPGLAKLLRTLVDSDSAWQVWAFRQDGLYGIGVMQMAQ